MVAALGFALLGVALWPALEAPDIAGNWAGEQWGEVVLKKTNDSEYAGTYGDTFNNQPGEIQLKWSRVERQFKGTWREGQDRFGKIALRLVDGEIRGAWTTSKKSAINPGTPELADLLWKRLSGERGEAKTGIRVQVLLDLENHSREMLRKNVGFDQLTIMGGGITGTVDGKTYDNIQAVMAHRCRLESFEEADIGGMKKWWKATLFVPQDPASDGSNRQLSQKRLDEMQKQGVKFWLDHHREQSAVGLEPAPLTPEEKKQPDQRGTVLTPKQVVENGAKLYHSRQRIAVQFKVDSVAPIGVLDEKGKQHQRYALYDEEAPDFSVCVTQNALAALERAGVKDVAEHFTGKWIKVEGTVYGVGLDLISRPDTLWTYHLDLNSLDQLSEVDPAIPQKPQTALQVRIAAPEDMLVTVAGERGLFVKSPRLKVPAKLNLAPGQTYRLKITNIAGREGTELYPTVEIGPTTPHTDAFVAHNAIPVQFTDEDFDQVLAGNLVIKVIYLPDPEFQELALTGVETLLSTKLDPGTDPILEADRRGSILAVIRLGNKDVELPGTNPAPPTAPEEKKPGAASDLRFSNPIEVVLSMDSSKFMLDLDTGKTMDPPATIGRPEEKQMDVHTDQVQPYHYPKELIGRGLQGVEVKASDWDALAAEVHRALTGDAVGPLKQMDLGPEKKPTYFFKTRDGALGVLQLLEIVDDPKGIRLRYKKVESGPGSLPALSPAAPSTDPMESGAPADPLAGEEE